MPDNSVTLSKVSLTISIAGKSFTLEAPTTEIVFNKTTAPTSGKVNLVYHASYADAIDLGSLGNLTTIFQDVVDSLNTVLSAAGGGGSVNPATMIQQLTTQVKQVPLLNNAADVIVNTNVRITDLVLGGSFTRDSASSGASTNFSGSFGLGLVFFPDAGHMPQLFNVKVVSFGGMITLNLSKNGLTIPNFWPS